MTLVVKVQPRRGLGPPRGMARRGMAYTSIVDLFKIGLGPSSSHTVGPMRAAALFVAELIALGAAPSASRVVVDLYGSLALTGRGHGTDRAVMLGLEGFRPESIAPEEAEARVAAIRSLATLQLNGTSDIAFSPERDIVWHVREVLARHPNGMRVSAFAADETALLERTYFSIGGGFVERENALTAAVADANVPYPFASAAELLARGSVAQLAVWQIVLANEDALRSRAQTDAYMTTILDAMNACASRGLITEGILPGGLNVRRRAPRLHKRLIEKPDAAFAMMDYVNVIAMAVNEENAAGGRVVTAPTNGAAGVIPAVLHYYRRYGESADRDGETRLLLTATAIGALYKANASISGAEVGCQGEVGVACSMAAGGLVAALGGTNEQVENAAEIGMEHSLGMTCDPIGGLVQVPCIERNAVGAVRAIQAARMAMEDAGDHVVSLDHVIEVMYRTGLDMQSAYKETSLGGLAVSVVEC
jgi:L-serine dehydratase